MKLSEKRIAVLKSFALCMLFYTGFVPGVSPAARLPRRND